MTVVAIRDAGWLYLLENPSMPGLCKVGMTTRRPEERATELFSTGVPTPFRLVASWPTDDPRGAERAAHEALSRYRTLETREWFALPAARALPMIEEALGVTPPKRRVLRVLRFGAEALGWFTLLAMITGLAFQS